MVPVPAGFARLKYKDFYKGFVQSQFTHCRIYIICFDEWIMLNTEAYVTLLVSPDETLQPDVYVPSACDIMCDSHWL